MAVTTRGFLFPSVRSSIFNARPFTSPNSRRLYGLRITLLPLDIQSDPTSPQLWRSLEAARAFTRSCWKCNFFWEKENVYKFKRSTTAWKKGEGLHHGIWKYVSLKKSGHVFDNLHHTIQKHIDRAFDPVVSLKQSDAPHIQHEDAGGGRFLIDELSETGAAPSYAPLPLVSNALLRLELPPDDD